MGDDASGLALRVAHENVTVLVDLGQRWFKDAPFKVVHARIFVSDAESFLEPYDFNFTFANTQVLHQ